MHTTWLKKSLSTAVAGGYLSINKQQQTYSNCESKSRQESKCDAYNSFYDIFFEKRREELCKREPGCNFRGKGITGTCFPKYKIAKYRSAHVAAGEEPATAAATRDCHRNIDRSGKKKAWRTPPPVREPSPSSSSLHRPSTRIHNPSGGGGGGVAVGVRVVRGEDSDSSQIEVLMKQQFTSSVADQIVNSHQVGSCTAHTHTQSA